MRPRFGEYAQDKYRCKRSAECKVPCSITDRQYKIRIWLCVMTMCYSSVAVTTCEIVGNLPRLLHLSYLVVTKQLDVTRRALFIWWRHQMETFSALLAICAGNSPVPGEFPAQRPVTRSFDVFFDLRLDKRLSKQSWGWWFETLLHPLWRHRDGIIRIRLLLYYGKIKTRIISETSSV